MTPADSTPDGDGGPALGDGVASGRDPALTDIPWHALSPDETLLRLGADRSGLTPAEAEGRLQQYGPNRLERIKPVSALRILVSQFSSFVVLLLLAAAIVALLMGNVVESLAIGLVLAINTTLGFLVEFRARLSMDALLREEVPLALVLRGGEAQQLPSDRLVPGDVIQVDQGDVVPADARLLEAAALRTNEALLTGESLPIDKDPASPSDPGAALADRVSMIYWGSAVTSGRGTAVVIGTGSSTEVGRVGTLIAGIEESKTPLERRLDALGRKLVWLTLGITAFVTGLGILRGLPAGLMIETGIALAIAAVPEALPAIATIALAVGLRRMARRNALVRRLSSVEALGAATVVCTDKTGTLTSGQMTVTAIATADRTLSVTGGGFSRKGQFLDTGHVVDPLGDPQLIRLFQACALTSRATVALDGREAIGDPTDAAVAVLALKAGVDVDALRDALPQAGEIPFSSDLLATASIHQRGDESIVFAKGSPEALAERSTRWASPTGDRALDADARAALRKANDTLAADGLRVIALADGRGVELADLTLLGLVGIVDPPAEGVKETIATLHRAGIRTVMVTGDQRATAEAIARELGMTDSKGASLDGRQISRLSAPELARQMADTRVLSRVSPEDKVRIVSALQERGDVVAMIGDGVNDAAALKRADVGVAMGRRGTDIAKQTAAMVLSDDRFQTIGSAVEEGRVIFDNIRKFVFYLFSCNLAEILVLLGAGLVAAPMPLLPLQILWLNLVTDTFPALALALEAAEPEVMERPPRDPEEEILSGSFLRAVTVYALLITAVTLGAFAWALRSGDLAGARTVAFMTLALAQLFHLGTARARGPVMSPGRMFANPWAIAAVPLVVALQVVAVSWAPISSVLGTTSLGRDEWLVVATLSVIPAAIGQAVAFIRHRGSRSAKPAGSAGGGR